MLTTLLPTLTTSPLHYLNDPACPTLRSVVIADNTRTGATAFADMLEAARLPGSDFRNLFDYEGTGLEGVEKLDRHDVVNLQFTSYVSML